MMKNLNWVQTIDLNLLACGSDDLTYEIKTQKSKNVKNCPFYVNERAAYVDNIILKSDTSNIAKLRICAHNLEIEKSHYFQINRTERFCKLICNDLEIEDENHFLWQCEKYRKEREILCTNFISNLLKIRKDSIS